MLVYAGLFTLSVLILFVIIAVVVNGFMIRQMDSAISDELAEVRSDAGGEDVARIRPVIENLELHAGGFFYLLQDRNGHIVAGNLTELRPQNGSRTLKRDHVPHQMPNPGPLRGRGIVLADGSYLFVGTGTEVLSEVRRTLLRAFLWSVGSIALLGLSGGLVMSLLVLRRIEAMSRISREIMAGRLSHRIPLTGSRDEFDRLAGSLNEMLDRIETLMSGMRQISDDVAHDLRTPLSRLRQRLELARLRDRTTTELHADLDGAIAQVDAILHSFSALLRIAQIEARGSREGFAPVDLAALLRDLAETYEPVVEGAGRTLLTVLPDRLPMTGDAALLTQLFVNLIENALRHTPLNSVIRLEAEPTGGGVVASVVDDGPGIPAEQRDFVFGRFARLDASRSTPGSGLGLSLVRAIAALHDGAVTLADNKPGLRASVTFPARPDHRGRHDPVGSRTQPV